MSEDTVEHHFGVCSQSRRNGSVELRRFKFLDGVLHLSVDYEDKTRFEARWKLIP